jgi:endoglucanase
VLRALAAQSPNGPWAKVAANAFTLIKTTAPLGYSPDWAAYQEGSHDGQFIVDPQKRDIGSYDAIRVYLWAGLTASTDPLAKPWLAALHGMRDKIASTGVPPEKVATTTGATTGEGPIGFWAALLPYFTALGDARAAGLAQTHLAAFGVAAPRTNLAGQPNQTLQPNQPFYYDEVLMLFGTGAADGRYRFDDNGKLVPRWENSCQTANARS